MAARSLTAGSARGPGVSRRWCQPGAARWCAAPLRRRIAPWRGPARLPTRHVPGWRPVTKKRRVSGFSLASGLILAPAAGPGQQPRCEVELTEVRTRGQDWWTLGFEATGPAELLRSELQAAATLVFAHALPGGVEPGPDESRSYAEWLGQRPGAESNAGAVDLARLTCDRAECITFRDDTHAWRASISASVAMSKGSSADYGGHKRSGCSPVAGSAVGSITLSSR